MKPVNTSRRRGRRKTRKLFPKVPSGEQMLPDVGADSPEITEEGLPALHAASFYKELPTIQHLVETRPWWINGSDSQGYRPLHMVLSSRGSPSTYTCLRYLLEHEADVNVTTDSGQTPLHLAASEGLLECVEILVKAGADVLVKDSMGLTPLDLACVWCHRKVARYLKDCEWQANKTRELEERKQAQALYRDLLNTFKHSNLNKKTFIDEKMAGWAKSKGLPLLKDFSPRVQESKYHNQCLLPDHITSKPHHPKHQPEGPEKDRSTTAQLPAALSCSPWTIFMGLQPEKPPKEPDLRDTVTLWKDSSTQKLLYTTKWASAPHPTPNLPLDVVERVLFPRAFPSRITTSQSFEPLSIDKVQHRGCPQGRSTSPWTEVAMHLAEVLELGHY
uniref:Ankyrin repeat domain 53 n=2 Tax=Kryptolebias marmoratus TaxID=37003 RepID=A0A3Q3AZT6_KRYMA